jgi:hypothetical protein
MREVEGREGKTTYQYRRIIRNIGRCLLFGLFFLDDFDIFDIAATKDDEVELLLRGWNEVLNAARLCAVGKDVL